MIQGKARRRDGRTFKDRAARQEILDVRFTQARCELVGFREHCPKPRHVGSYNPAPPDYDFALWISRFRQPAEALRPRQRVEAGD